MTSLALPGGGAITNGYDALGRLLKTTLVGSAATVLNSHAYAYNPDHQRQKQTFKASNYVDYTYDAAGQLKTAVGKESGGSPVRALENLRYGYDPAGNLRYRTNNALEQTFSVDNRNQLATATRSGTLTVADAVNAAVGSVTVNAQAATVYADRTFAKEGVALTDGANTFTVAATASSGAQDTATLTVNLPATVTFTYDLNGNLTGDGRRTFEYDDENQLTAVQVANAWRAEFQYDGFGRRRVRIEKTWNGSAFVTVSTTRYVYDGMVVLQERDANNLPQVTYTRGVDLGGGLEQAGGIGGLLARSHGYSGGTWGTHSFYHADGSGNVTALLNSQRVLVARYQYDPFGNLLAQAGPLADANTYRFSSKEWHPNSGLYYYGYRFYDPTLQRWLNRDPIGELGGTNLYGFVGNYPVNLIDPFGLDLFVVTESGLIGHQYLFGDNGDGTFWYTDFGPMNGGLNRIYGPGQTHFGPNMHPNEVDDPNKSIVIHPCDQETTQRIRGLAKQRADNPTQPKYCFIGYNCQSYVGDLVNDERRLNPPPPISNVNVNSWPIVNVPPGVRIR